MPRRRFPASLKVLCPVAALVAVVVSAFVPIPYYELSPGEAFPTSELVSVGGATRHEPEGEVFFPTVSVSSRRSTLLEGLAGWLDGDVDIVDERLIRPPEVSREDLRRFNLGLMSTSKDQALGVAFERLGFDAIRGEGAVVIEVSQGTAADGILEEEDLITGVDGERVALHADAVRLIGGHRPGETVALEVTGKSGSTRRVEVVLGARPDDPERAFLGVVLQTRNLGFEYPFDIDIDSAEIGGPSAGLAFTLQALDVLTPGELTGGKRVAATGTMELDGRVGDVGGVSQKTVAVLAAGADVFLVPRGEAEQARRRAGGRLEVVAVDDLEDALRALARLGGDTDLARLGAS